jgi:serine/threonine protein kinase/tetratricopeptide (TPR) repeat protein
MSDSTGKTPLNSEAGPSLTGLQDEQRRRWEDGERVLVETYVQRHPALHSDAEQLLDLVYHEVLLREEYGEVPRLEEYLERFPHLAGPLRQQFEVHGVLESSRALDGALPATQFGDDRGEAEAPVAVPGYEVVRELGRGGMGVVYQVWHARLNRSAALKMILAGAHAGPEELARFRTEAEAVARLQHPNIVQIYDVGEHAGRPYLVLEYVEGGTLAKKLQGTPLPGRQAAALVESMARAVHHAHQRGVVHRDLTPGNVLLASRHDTEGAASGNETTIAGQQPHANFPKITDFGLAKLIIGGVAGTQTGAILGTPSYMAPEQAGGRSKEVGPATDVYALGAIFYECLTGRPPFKAQTALDTLLQVTGAEPVPPARLQPAVPRDLETICLKCLQKAAGKRYGSALALADDLRRFRMGEPIQARPVSLAERLWRWSLRNRSVACLLTAVAVSLLAGTGVATYFAVRAEAALRAETRRRAQARAALDEMSSQLIEDWLARRTAKELTPAQKAFLQKALSYYEEFAADAGQDETTRSGVAGACVRIGNIRHTLGQSAEAEAGYGRGRALYAQLMADFPAVPDYRGGLAVAQNSLGNLFAAAGRAREAEGAYGEAFTLFKQLAADFPAVSRYRHDLAGTQINMGALLLRAGRAQEGEQAYQDALAIKKQLVTEFSAMPEYRVELATGYNNLGSLLRNSGRTREAEGYFREALVLSKQLSAEFPAAPEYRQDSARYHHNLGFLFAATGRTREAEGSYRDALAIKKQLVAKFPAVPDYRVELAGSCSCLGNLLASKGQTREAESTYRDALALCNQLTADFPTVPKYRHDLAMSHGNLGILLAASGRAREAEASYRDALALYKQLAAEFPGVPEYRQDLAGGHINLGTVLKDSGGTLEAEKSYREALAIEARLTTEFPTVPEYRLYLVRSHHNLGVVFAATRRVQEAESAYGDALALCKQLAADFPAVPEYRNSMATSQYDLGILLARAGRSKDAERAYRDALALYQQLAAEFPTVLEYRQYLGRSFTNLGSLLEASGRAREAEEAFRDALVPFKQLATEFAAVPDYQNELALTMGNWAMLLHRRKEFGAARRLLEEALPHHLAALRANPRHLYYRRPYRLNRQILAETLVDLGDHVAASATAGQLLQAAVDLATDPYNAACLLARCVPLVGQDSQQPETRRRELAKAYSDRAVAALRQAVQHGYKDLAHIQKDKDLEPLRSRADFQKLLAKLKEKTGPK